MCSNFAVDTLIPIPSYSGILAVVEFCSTIKAVTQNELLL